jgi:CheY-like chemotaxis protein
MRLLIVDDDLRDLRVAIDAARSVGIRNIEVFNWLQPAMKFLEEGFRGEGPLPDAVLLDLAIGCESGYEVLRARHSAHANSKIRVIVWSELDEDRNREICELFNIDEYVSKQDGAAALRQALRRISPVVVN